MKVNVNAWQQQTNVADCVAFAIASMIHILTGAYIGRTSIFVEDLLKFEKQTWVKSTATSEWIFHE